MADRRSICAARVRRVGALALAVLALATSTPARAEEPGSWRFDDAARPVKVVVIGGSVAAYPAGGFSQWLPEVCPRIEVVNRAKAKLGAAELRQRFVAQVLKNRRLKLPELDESWLVFLGGLNSVGSPDKTNLEVARTLALAKGAGMMTMGVSINPWGAETDRRWQGVDGIAYFEHTQRTVDFLLGRLGPAEAFGAAHARTLADTTRFAPGELPDVAVDLWTSGLRHEDAPLRDPGKLARAARTSSFVKKRLASLPEDERPAALERLLEQAAALPRWFMKPELIGFDAIHPNALGHREIARAICAKAPPSWGCGCDRLEQLAWDRRTNKPKVL